MIKLEKKEIKNPDLLKLIHALNIELRSRYQNQQDIYDQHNHLKTDARVVVAYCDNHPAGCGAFRQTEDAATVEIKRMFVDPKFRGKGIAKAILSFLEEWAAEEHYVRAVLETGNKQPEAIGLYEKAGYRIIPNYGPYAEIEDSLCFEKILS